GLKDDFQNSYAFDRLSRETSVVQTVSANSGHYSVGYKKSTFSWTNDGRLKTLVDFKDNTTQAHCGGFQYDHVGRLTDITCAADKEAGLTAGTATATRPSRAASPAIEIACSRTAPIGTNTTKPDI